MLLHMCCTHMHVHAQWSLQRARAGGACVSWPRMHRRQLAHAATHACTHTCVPYERACAVSSWVHCLLLLLAVCAPVSKGVRE